MNTPQPPTAEPLAPLTGSALHAPTKPLLIGGVMRCCSHTLANALVQEAEGETLQCKYTDDPLHSLIFRNGCWEWWHDRPNVKAELPR